MKNKIFGTTLIIATICALLCGCSTTPKYEGEYKDGKPNGHGTLTYSYGLKYVGQVKDGKEDGAGTLTFSDGREYVGQFKCGKPNGQGTFNWPGGTTYTGQWKDGKEDGAGTLTLYFKADEREYHLGDYAGQWENGWLRQGMFTGTDGKKYVGQWKDGKRHGLGTSYNPDGSIYQKGTFKDGEYVGK